MIALLAEKQAELAALCRGFHVARLDVFGSAVTGGFVPDQSDLDFLVSFEPPPERSLTTFLDFKEALESLFGIPVDLVEREAVEANPNYIRRRRILAEAEPIYG